MAEQCESFLPRRWHQYLGLELDSGHSGQDCSIRVVKSSYLITSGKVLPGKLLKKRMGSFDPGFQWSCGYLFSLPNLFSMVKMLALMYWPTELQLVNMLTHSSFPAYLPILLKLLLHFNDITDKLILDILHSNARLPYLQVKGIKKSCVTKEDELHYVAKVLYFKYSN